MGFILAVSDSFNPTDRAEGGQAEGRIAEGRELMVAADCLTLLPNQIAHRTHEPILGLVVVGGRRGVGGLGFG